MNDAAARVGRRLRRSRAYGMVRRKMLSWARTSDFLARLVGVARGSPTRPPAFTAGNAVPNDLGKSYPPVLYVAVHLSTAELTQALVDVQERQLREADVRPVVLVCGSGMDVVRPYGFAMEALVPRDRWSGPRSWDRYVEANVRRIQQSYGIQTTVVLSGSTAGSAGE